MSSMPTNTWAVSSERTRRTVIPSMARSIKSTSAVVLVSRELASTPMRSAWRPRVNGFFLFPVGERTPVIGATSRQIAELKMAASSHEVVGSRVGG